MRFLCVIGMIFLLIVDKSESATEAPCTTRTMAFTWLGQSQSLKTCEPTIEIVVDEDFTILSESNPGYIVGPPTSLGFAIRNKMDVKFLPTNLWRVFPDLVVVQVEDCSVKAVNENNFKGLTKLQYLNLADNKIEHIASDAFVDLFGMKVLNLCCNRIPFLGKNTFASLKALKELRLDGNEIQFLHPQIFSSLVNVEKMELDRNSIHNLDENIFERLASLQKIFLTRNKLERIPNLFKNNLKLKEIWFDGNRIKFIDGSMFDHLSSLEYVDLRSNLCLNKDYTADSFGAMRNYLKQKCTENSNQEALKKLELKLENSEQQKADVQMQLDSKSREIEALRRQFDTLKQEALHTNKKLELLMKNMAGNLEILSIRVEAVNETAQDV